MKTSNEQLTALAIGAVTIIAIVAITATSLIAQTQPPRDSLAQSLHMHETYNPDFKVNYLAWIAAKSGRETRASRKRAARKQRRKAKFNH
jgi:hypothetical protein